MSAFLIDHEHLNMIVTWAIDNGIEDISPQKWFQEFYLENVRSLEYRYPESHQELIYWGLSKYRYVPNGDAIFPRKLEKEIAIAKSIINLKIMTNNENVPKQYVIKVSVNIETLISSHLEDVGVQDGEELPSIEDLILSSTNWMDRDGIQASEVYEIQHTRH